MLLGSAESSSVGDIINSVIGLRVLTVDTSNLDEVFIGNLLVLSLLLSELWKADMDGSSEGGTEIGWARGDVTEMLIMREFADSLDMSSGSAESVEDLEDTSSLLHGDDSELILLIAPDVERFIFVHEDTSSGWPVSVKVACLQESVSLLEKDVIGD